MFEPGAFVAWSICDGSAEMGAADSVSEADVGVFVLSTTLGLDVGCSDGNAAV